MGLNFGLIHPRSGPFTGGRADGVCAVRGRWRTPVNAGQHCWKACWGQPLRSSNLLSSATSDQAIHQAGYGPVRLRSLICSLIHSTYIGTKYPKGAGARFWMLSQLVAGPLDIPALNRPVRVRILAAIAPGPQRRPHRAFKGCAGLGRSTRRSTSARLPCGEPACRCGVAEGSRSTAEGWCGQDLHCRLRAWV